MIVGRVRARTEGSCEILGTGGARQGPGPLASREYRLTGHREGLEEIRSIRRN
jgi:hypothetical protein